MGLFKKKTDIEKEAEEIVEKQLSEIDTEIEKSFERTGYEKNKKRSIFKYIGFLLILISLKFYFFSFYVVEGNSMNPTFKEKDAIILLKDNLVTKYNSIDRGDIVIFKPPVKSLIFEQKFFTKKGDNLFKIPNLNLKNIPIENFEVSYFNSTGNPIFKIEDNESLNIQSEKNGEIIIKIYSGDLRFMKRIVALPNETIKFENGYVYVKSPENKEFQVLLEPYLGDNEGKTYLENNINSEYKVPENSYFVMGDNREFSDDSRICFQVCESEANHFISRESIYGIQVLDITNILFEPLKSFLIKDNR